MRRDRALVGREGSRDAPESGSPTRPGAAPPDRTPRGSSMAFAIARAVAAASPASPRPGRSRTRRRALVGLGTHAGGPLVRPSAFRVGSARPGLFPYHVGAWEVLCETVLGLDPGRGGVRGRSGRRDNACGCPRRGQARAHGRPARPPRTVSSAASRRPRDRAQARLPEDAHVRCSRSNLFVSVTAPAGGRANPGAPAGFNGGRRARTSSSPTLTPATTPRACFELPHPALLRVAREPRASARGRRVDAARPDAARLERAASRLPRPRAAARGSPGDGTKTGNYLNGRRASGRTGVSEDEGLLIAPDGAYGEPTMDYLEMGKWALLLQDDATLDAPSRWGVGGREPMGDAQRVRGQGAATSRGSARRCSGWRVSAGRSFP